jgi:hypothetical protein
LDSGHGQRSRSLPHGAALREPAARAGNDKPVLPDPATVTLARKDQNEELDLPAGFVARFAEGFQKTPAILIVLENELSP